MQPSNQNTANPVIPSVEDTSNFPMSGAPTETPVISTTSPSTGGPTKPAGRFSGKVIVTLFGMLLLVGGIGVGVYLAARPQLLKQKASGTGTCGGALTCKIDGIDTTFTCSDTSSETACNDQTNSIKASNSACDSTSWGGKCSWVPNGGGGTGCNNLPEGQCIPTAVATANCSTIYSTGSCSSSGDSCVDASSCRAFPQCPDGLQCSGTYDSAHSYVCIPRGGTQPTYCIPSSGGGGGGSSSGTYCANYCCQIDAGASTSFVIRKYTCDNNAGPCLQNYQNAGGPGSRVCITAPSCGAVQLDIFNGSADTGLAVRAPAGQSCTGGGGGGGCVSDWCAGQDQCVQSGGTPGANGPRPSGGNCQTGMVMCCPATTGGGGGTNPTPTPGPRACGYSCTSDSQCITNGTGSGNPQVRCIGGLCQNVNCPGKTIPGTICACDTLNACGQPCSAALGLCQAGSTCSYITGSVCTPTSSSNPTTYCVPTNPLPTGWTRPFCTGNDVNNHYVLNANGGNPTVAEVQQACQPTPTAVCSNIKTYDTSWNLLSSAQLAALQTGTTVYFSVTGTISSGNFDKARFTINGAQSESSLTKPGSPQEFYIGYTIPSGVSVFNVTAQLHDPQSNQWF